MPQSEKTYLDNEKNNNNMGDNNRQIVVLNVVGSSPTWHPSRKDVMNECFMGIGTVFPLPLIFTSTATLSAFLHKVTVNLAPNMPRKSIDL